MIKMYVCMYVYDLCIKYMII
uniref:Uncharacterized protein n=1 Tax=Anguilla anguilla TaxID=7936 RepID=A0A0E9XH63_ANGAN